MTNIRMRIKKQEETIRTKNKYKHKIEHENKNIKRR